MPRGQVPESTVRKAQRLGQLLRSAREAAGKSREGLGREAEVSAETIRKFELGRSSTPELFTVAALCRVLQLNLDELLDLCATRDGG